LANRADVLLSDIFENFEVKCPCIFWNSIYLSVLVTKCGRVWSSTLSFEDYM